MVSGLANLRLIGTGGFIPGAVNRRIRAPTEEMRLLEPEVSTGKTRAAEPISRCSSVYRSAPGTSK
jgi:hypothetical protein